MKSPFFDIPIICTIDDGRSKNPLNGDQYTTAREIWTKAPKAAARKATAAGVHSVCIKATESRFYVFQVAGYTPEKGLFCYMLNESGQIIAPN